MLVADYYKILGLKHGSTVEDIKKAYRNKAREFHPDINHSPDAKDMFISVTEAYEFLLTYFKRMKSNEEAYRIAMQHWKRYRQTRSRQKATVYSQTSYVRFKKTNFYKTTRIFNITTSLTSMVISVIMLVLSIYGYFYRIHHPLPGIENPTTTILVVFILLGMIMFIVSLVHFKIYLETSRKYKDRL